jgi:hypothetical protein
MCRIAKWSESTLLAGCLLVGSTATVVHAQPGNPYAVYGPSYYYAGYNPYAGLMHGSADIVRSQGQYLVDRQQASLMREQVVSARFDNRRKQLEQWLWERENLPSPEDERQRRQREELRRSRNDPPVTEIWSAKSLNDLLDYAQKVRSPGLLGESLPLSEELLSKLNVTSGRRGGNIGLFKNGKVFWPLLLRRPAFANSRERLDQLLSTAMDQAGKGQIEAEVLEEMIREGNTLDRDLRTMARESGDQADWNVTMYLDAREFLRQFDDAVRVLQQPDAARFLTGKYTLKAKTVADLLRFMGEQGLRFAPATAGGESAYVALHRALVTYLPEQGFETRPKRDR